MTSQHKRKKRQQDALRRMIEASERLGLYDIDGAIIGLREAHAGHFLSDEALDQALGADRTKRAISDAKAGRTTDTTLEDR